MTLALAMALANLLRRAVARFALQALGMLAATRVVAGGITSLAMTGADLLA